MHSCTANLCPLSETPQVFNVRRAPETPWRGCLHQCISSLSDGLTCGSGRQLAVCCSFTSHFGGNNQTKAASNIFAIVFMTAFVYRRFTGQVRFTISSGVVPVFVRQTHP